VRAKLAHDTRLVPTIAAGSWVFLKAESLRGLAQAKDVRRQDLRQVVGLEPIVEQTGVQIPLL
jgi:hypothetical protein